MAQLTWRDVATPNLSGTFQGYETFSKLLGDAVGAAKSAVTGLDTAKSDLMNRHIALSLARTNADGLREAIQTGRLGDLDITSDNFLRRVNDTNLAALGPAAIAARDRAEMDLSQAHTTFNQQQLLDA